ncbi:MAG: alpha/beta hydrolase fold domain-containing protein [Gammaproteobacteria bacterium]|nr:alpha/beta hydrolase fold domain-containing protein [Gammaproteobacteria bacterium]
MTALYREMNLAQLEIAYSPSSMIGGDYMPFIQRYISESAAARQHLDCVCDVQYGSRKNQVFDLFHGRHPKIGKPPLHLFIHGGYWQELSHKESAFMAGSLVNRGISFAALNYTLAPLGSIKEMVDECYQCLEYMVRNSDELDIDPLNISISGHSAGAQLLMQLLIQYQHTPEVKGVRLAIPISGIYDLTPLCHTSINRPLFLTHELASELSPQFQSAKISQSVLVAVAENDTNEFRRQAREYHEKLREAGVDSEFIELQTLNHFDIVLEVKNQAFPIIRSIVSAASKPV